MWVGCLVSFVLGVVGSLLGGGLMVVGLGGGFLG